ncbi:MAG TPA: polymer-forming cytoskeletal protein [Pelobium sp.]|jgi:cytoskeletal protein CcmA (bactofilin family)|nr:polymer-forming cytoskeletal protein [Pelobium sp.]
MFGNKKAEKVNGEQKAGSINIIGLGTEIKGDLTTKGDIRIDGKITGSVKSKAKVVVSTSGEVEGDIFSESAEISGKVSGDVATSEILFLKATANLKGDVFSNKLVVESGANLVGNCQTGITQTKSILKPSLDGATERQAEKREATA